MATAEQASGAGRVKKVSGMAARDENFARRRFSSISRSTNPSSIGGRLEIVFEQPVADQPEGRGHDDVGRRIVERIHADAAEDQDRWEQHPVGNAQKANPEADQGQVDDDEHQIPDPHRGRSTPQNKLRLLEHDLRPRARYHEWSWRRPSGAITAFGGMPSVSKGTNEVCAAGLFALSGAATPSIAPRRVLESSS